MSRKVKMLKAIDEYGRLAEEVQDLREQHSKLRQRFNVLDEGKKPSIEFIQVVKKLKVLHKEMGLAECGLYKTAVYMKYSKDASEIRKDFLSSLK